VVSDVVSRGRTVLGGRSGSGARDKRFLGFHAPGRPTLNTLSWHISDHYPLFVGFALPD
jgi:hypothetical protein